MLALWSRRSRFQERKRTHKVVEFFLVFCSLSLKRYAHDARLTDRPAVFLSLSLSLSLSFSAAAEQPKC